MTRGTVGERFTTAVGFAREAHHGDVRKKTSIPYLSHLLAVSSLAIEDAAEDLLLTEHLEDIAIAAVLHDVVEDTVDKVEEKNESSLITISSDDTNLLHEKVLLAKRKLKLVSYATRNEMK